MESTSATIRFYGELNEFLPRHQSHKEIVVSYRGRRTIKDLIESLGIPHVEIHEILVNDRDVGFEYIVHDDDSIQVYPGFQASFPRRFIIDDNVAKLCPLLRMLGFDSLYNKGASDSSIATLAKLDDRTVLTRDKGLLKRKDVRAGLYIHSIQPIQQLQEVVDRLQLRAHCQPFSRCLLCNQSLVPLSAEEIPANPNIPPEVRRWTQNFFQCTHCHKVFWQGSHHESMEKLVRQILDITR